MNEQSENFNKELGNTKKNETRLRNDNWNKKIHRKEINSRLENTEEWISYLEAWDVKINQAE